MNVNSNADGADGGYGFKYPLPAWSGVVGYTCSGKYDGLRKLGGWMPEDSECGSSRKALSAAKESAGKPFPRLEGATLHVRTHAPAI